MLITDKENNMKKILIVLLFLFIAVGAFAESDMLNQVTAKLIEYVESAEAFLTEQTPEYIEQLLAFEVYKIKTWFIFTLILTILTFIGVLVFIVFGIVDDSAYFGIAVCIFLIAAFLAYCSICVFMDLKQIELAPKVYILEYLMSLR